MKNGNHSNLTRREFLKLASLAGGTVALSPLLKACAGNGTSVATASVDLDSDLLSGLEELGIDDFFQESYRRLMVRDPELLTSLGLSEIYGTGNATLTDISDSFIRKTQGLESGILALLRRFDHTTFTPSQSLTSDVYDWYLEDLERGHGFMYDDYPVNPTVTSVHFNLFSLLTIYHPLNNSQDAQDFISRLSQVDDKLTSLIDGLRRREENEVILPAFIFPYVTRDIVDIAQGSPETHPYTATFQDRLTGVGPEEKASLLEQVKDQVGTVVQPAYQSLADTLNDLRSHASNTVGVWQFDDGEAYYTQCLRRHTTTEMDPEEIHELGKTNVARIEAEMRGQFDLLGYPAGDTITSLFDRLTNEVGTYQGQEAVAAYEQAIQEAEGYLPQAFSILPRAGVEVVGGPEGDYYMNASYDGSRPGLFFARTTGQTPKFGVKSLAFHETIPGHHLQISLAQEQAALPALRQGMQFNAHVEGWALYAEKLMAELGVYADDPAGDLGRLRMEAYRAARLVVDTGIHSMRWDFNRAVDTLVAATGFPTDRAQSEITRYCVWPGQATSYYIGFLKILELRQRCKDALGERFDLKEFHNIVLLNGSLPLQILERLINEYLGG